MRFSGTHNPARKVTSYPLRATRYPLPVERAFITTSRLEAAGVLVQHRARCVGSRQDLRGYSNAPLRFARIEFRYQRC